VGIPESFKVGWYPHKKTGSSHLNRGFFALPVWGAYIWRGLFSEFYGSIIMRMLLVQQSKINDMAGDV